MDWANIFTPLAIAATAAGVTLVGLFRNSIAEIVTELTEAVKTRIKRRGEGFDDGFRMGQKFTRLFHQLTKCRYVARVLIFDGKNCGGLPVVGKPYRVSLRLGWYDPEPGDPSKEARRDPEELYDTAFGVDDHYIGLLVKLRAQKRIELVTAELPEDCLIGSLYRNEGVVYAQWFFLELDGGRGAMAYASVASYVRRFTREETSNLFVRMERIRSLYRYGYDPAGTTFEYPSLKDQ